MKNKHESKYKKEKSKEKFEKLKEEIRGKFDVEHIFKPKINYNFSRKDKRKRESKEDYYKKLSTPKTIELTKRLKEKDHFDSLRIKEECPFKPNLYNKNLINLDDDYHENINKNPDKISNRLHKLAEQLKSKRDKMKREFQEAEIGNYSFAPNLDENSKKLIMKYQIKPIHQRVKIIIIYKIK